jgi:NADH-quinone oxidoreductase subunit G
VAAKLKAPTGDRMAAIAGPLAGAEEMFALKDLFHRLGSTNVDCREDGALIDPSVGRASYVFNSTIEGIERADVILLIGTNPRLEAAVLNARIRKRWRQGGLAIGVIGEQADLGYPYDFLGAGGKTLRELAEGNNGFAAKLKDAKAPMVIVGSAALARADGRAVLAAAARIAADAMGGKDAADWNAFNVLQTAASRVAGLDLGFVPKKPATTGVESFVAAAEKGELDVLFLLGADDIDMARLGSTFVVYQGTHGDAGAHRADVIFPASAYSEKSATYVNTEGRAQMTARAGFPPGDAKEDWAIIRALSPLVGHTLPYDTINVLRAGMYKVAPQLAALDRVTPAPADVISAIASGKGAPKDEPFRNAVDDFYLTNPIARASAVMAEMSALKKASGKRPGLSAAE